MKTYELRARALRRDGTEYWADVEVDAAELRRALAADPLDVEQASPATIHVSVSGNVLGTEELAEKMVQAIHQHSRRVYHRRQAVCPFAGPDKRRGNWRVTGRRSGDLCREDRRRGQRRVSAKLWPISMCQRTAWAGRRYDDSRAERRLCQRRAGGERREPAAQSNLFWRHPCARHPTPQIFVHLRSAYCPNCGSGYTTFWDRRHTRRNAINWQVIDRRALIERRRS